MINMLNLFSKCRRRSEDQSESLDFNEENVEELLRSFSLRQKHELIASFSKGKIDGNRQLLAHYVLDDYETKLRAKNRESIKLRWKKAVSQTCFYED